METQTRLSRHNINIYIYIYIYNVILISEI